MNREYKGCSKIDLINDYVVLDIETTGLDPIFDEIIEIGAIKIKNGIVVDSFSQLVKPSTPVSQFISELTGITNDMLKSAPTINEVLPKFIEFVSDMQIVGHNVNFDINFIYDNSIQISNKPFKNDFIDTLRLSRKLFKELKNHKLTTICDFLKFDGIEHHRALSDCDATFKLYEYIKNYINSKQIVLQELFKPKSNKLKAQDIISTNECFDETNQFYDKYCVFTGTLSVPRKNAMQLVVDLGGHCEDNVTKQTNFLVLGNIDYGKCKDTKSAKYKKAEQCILNGQDLTIISENVFWDLVGSSKPE